MKKTILSLLMATAATMVAQNPLNLVVTDNDDKSTFIPADEIDMVIFQPTPDYMDFPVYIGGSYVESSTTGAYRIELANAATDAAGKPTKKGDMTLSLVLTGPWSDDVTAPELPAGYYNIGNGSEIFTFDARRSSLNFCTDDNGDVTPMMIIDGTVDVRRNGTEYDIRAEVTTFEGLNLDARYRGPIELPAGAGEFVRFTEPLDVTFNGAQGRFYGNWYYPFSADLSMQLWSGQLTSEGYLTEGYVLYIEFNEPKPEDCMNPSQVVADGTYTPENREDFAYTYLPFRFNKGAIIDFLGQDYITRTRLEYIGADGSRKLGLITGGSFTVSDNGRKFDFDFITEEGVSIKGSYTGKPNIQNFCDNDVKEPKRPYSTLTSDHTLKFVPESIALSYNEGRSILDDLNTLVLMLTDPMMEKGDFVMIEMLAEEEIVSDGTYDMSWTLHKNGMIPGTIDYSQQMLFSWYGDLDTTDEDGYQTDLGCLASGTMTVSTNADGTKKFVLDFVDDNGYKISGEFNGALINANDIAAQKPAKLPKRNRFKAHF